MWFGCASASSRLTPRIGDVLEPESGKCSVLITEEPGVGALDAKLRLGSNTVASVMDVAEIFWTGETLVYSVKPIYGDPGIYVWRCASSPPVKIVRPTNFSKAWPQGADYFRLVGEENGKLTYEYAPDVDSKSLDGDLRTNRKTIDLPVSMGR